MDKFSIAEIKKVEEQEEIQSETSFLKSRIEHLEAVKFFEQHRDFLEHYAKGKVNIQPAPEGLNTCAFNLETNTVYMNSMFYKKKDFSDEKTLFAACHEIEHFSEKKAMLSEEGGERKFENYLAKIKASRAFSLMDNCNGDIRENRAVVSRTNIGMRELEKKIYKEDLFPETDFTSVPRHIQFCQALLREARVSGEECQVSSDARKALGEVTKVKGLMDIMTNPGTPMSTRLKLQEKYVWPKVETLLEKDMEDKKKQQELEKKEKERSDGKGEQGEGEKEDGNEKDEEGQEQEKGGKGGQEKENKHEDGKSNGDERGETDPNKIFADDYAKAEKNFPETIPIEEIEKAFEVWKEAQKGKDSVDWADEDYAKNIGVEKKDLQEYRKIVESLEKIVNPETDLSVIEELKNLFSRIISKRLKQIQAPKYLVEEGDEIVDFAQLVADFKAGNLQPKVWEDTEIKEKKGDRFGEVEITLVCDRSGSMDGQKAIEQRKSAVLVMEVLKEFSELCEAEKINVDKPLEVRSEIYSFADSADDKIPLKKMSADLGEAERIVVLKKLHDTSGSSTPDFSCLEAIDKSLNDQFRIKIKIGELKKIVIVLTDGKSNDSSRTQGVLKSLRDSGVIAIGIGITNEGATVLSTYAPSAQVVEDVSKLPIVLGDILKEYLKDI